MDDESAKEAEVGGQRILLGIATRNRSEILVKAIESALAQLVPYLSVAVIDDDSKDGTPELRMRYPEVDWNRRTPAEGYMSARNDFMARPGFDYFVGLDDDAWFLQDNTIAAALREFLRDPSLAAVAFDVASPDKPALRPITTAEPIGTFVGCGHMLRLSAVRVVGGYEPAPGTYGGEEKDLCLRLMDAGYRIVRLPGVMVWHEKTPVARDLAFQHKSGVSNDLAMALRRSPWFLLPAVLPYKIFRHIYSSYRTGFLFPCLSGMMMFVRLLRLTLVLRKPVRASTLIRYLRVSRA
jgi:GT2 family glycosyltransferase